MKPGDLYKTIKYMWSEVEEEIPGNEILLLLKKEARAIKRYSGYSYDRIYTFLWNEKVVNVNLVHDPAYKWFKKISK